jgi:hypothetical protein
VAQLDDHLSLDQTTADFGQRRFDMRTQAKASPIELSGIDRNP